MYTSEDVVVFWPRVLLDEEDSLLLGDKGRLLLLLAPFEEEAVELLFFFASSASRAGAKDSTTAFKVLVSVIDERSAMGEKTQNISTLSHYINKKQHVLILIQLLTVLQVLK